MTSNLWRIEGGKLRLAFNPAQLAAWDSPARFTFLVCGTRSGKTSMSPWWLHREITETADPKGGVGNDYLAMTSTYRLFDNAFRPMMQEAFEQVLHTGRYWPAAQCIELIDPKKKRFWAKKASDPMWGRILMRTAEAWQSAEGMRARAAVCDEAGQDSFNLVVWESVLRRVSQDIGRVFAGTTPYNLGYLYTEIYERARRGDTDFAVLQFPSTTNPAFPPEEFERARRTMPAWRFNMMYQGLFERPAGLIYGDFDERYQWIDPIALDPSWPTVVGLDFGPLNTGAVWITQTPEGTLHLRQEYLEGNKTSPQHAQDIMRLSSGMNVIAYVGGAKSEHQYRWDWQAAGCPVKEPLIPDVEGGIDRVISFIKTKRFYVHKTCSHWRDEAGSYCRKLDASGEPTEAIADKAKYHELDSCRYAIGEFADAVKVGSQSYDDWLRAQPT